MFLSYVFIIVFLFCGIILDQKHRKLSRNTNFRAKFSFKQRFWKKVEKSLSIKFYCNNWTKNNSFQIKMEEGVVIKGNLWGTQLIFYFNVTWIINLIHVKYYPFLEFLSKVIEYQSNNLSSLLTFNCELFELLISEKIFSK